MYLYSLVFCAAVIKYTYEDHGFYADLLLVYNVAWMQDENRHTPA